MDLIRKIIGNQNFDYPYRMNEILEEGDPLLQQKVEVKLGVMGLEKQLKRLSIWQEAKE